jgi:CheY-like chemotaxis protein
LQLLADLHDAPDSIFLAVHEPEQDDYRLLQYVKARADYACTNLVALVVQEDIAQIQRRLRDMSISYLVKPFRIQDALALVSVPICRSGIPSDTRRA